MTLETFGSGVPLAPRHLWRQKAGRGPRCPRSRAARPAAPGLLIPAARLRGPPGAGLSLPAGWPPSPSPYLHWSALARGRGWAGQDHKSPDAPPGGLRASPDPAEVQVRRQEHLRAACRRQSPAGGGPAGHPCPPRGGCGRCPRGAHIPGPRLGPGCQAWPGSGLSAGGAGGADSPLSGSQDPAVPGLPWAGRRATRCLAGSGHPDEPA